MNHRLPWMLTLVAACLLMGCGESEEQATQFSCNVPQTAPYPDGIPYVGVHGGPGNNDYIDCTTAPSFVQDWHALKGAAVVQPNTFSPDGRFTYVTSSQPAEGDCTVWSLKVSDGTVAWCRAFDEQTLWSAVEVDQEGALYFTTGTSIHSLNADGSDRWSLEIPDGLDPMRSNSAIGLHFTPSGHVVTVTDQGEVLLVERAAGELITRLSVPDAFGFELPPVAPGGVLGMLLPEVVQADFQALQTGEPDALLATFSGAGNFSDNTIAVSPRGDLFVIGGNGTEGALFQVKMVAGDDGYTLEPGWRMNTRAGSASSPAVSPDGRQVKVSDGNSPTAIINPRAAGALSHIADIESCDSNTDADPEPAVCAPIHSVPLLTGPTFGTTPMLNGGIHFQYEVQVSDLLNTDDADVRAFDGSTLLWETILPDDLQWTSVITVTRNHLIGTGTRFTASGESILNIVELPATAESELLILDRETGELVFRAPVTDDSTATVTVGPDGGVYVNMFALMHIFSMNTRPVAGVIRFAPRGVD